MRGRRVCRAGRPGRIGPLEARRHCRAERLEELDRWKRAAIAELNALGIPDLKVESLTPLNGFYVNLEYWLPNGQAVKLLEDSKIYMGSQIERPGQERCYGVVADEKYLLVCEYGCNGADPKIVCYKRRQCDPA